MKKLSCYIGIHNYKTIDLTDCFTSTYTDRPTWGSIKHMVWYQQCADCKKRRAKDSMKKDLYHGGRHEGIEYARVGWVEYGKMYLGKNRGISTPPPVKTKPKLTVVKK